MEVKELRKINESLSKSVESFLKEFHISLNNIQLELNIFTDRIVGATLQKRFDVYLFY